MQSKEIDQLRKEIEQILHDNKAMEVKRDVTIDTLETMGIEWDLLYLGRVPQTKPEEEVVSGVVKPNFSYCTYGYVLSKSGIEKIRKYNVHKAIIPADEFLSATYVKHPRSDVSFKYPPTLKAYAVDPHICLLYTSPSPRD